MVVMVLLVVGGVPVSGVGVFGDGGPGGLLVDDDLADPAVVASMS